MTTKIPPPAAVKYDLYYLECVQPAANHRKFYLIFRANIEVTTVFGRIGTQGKTATSIQLSSGIAQAVAAATAGKKISGGYKQLTRVPRNLLSHLFKYISEYTYEYVNPPALAADFTVDIAVLLAILNPVSTTTEYTHKPWQEPNRLARFEDI